jgi:hypothetical protein
VRKPEKSTLRRSKVRPQRKSRKNLPSGDPKFGLSAELVVKKQFSLSDKVEVTFGVGPAWLHKIGGRVRIPLVVWWRSIFRFGLCRSEDWVGFSSQVTDIISVKGMSINNRSA